MDHIILQAGGGATDLDNLCLTWVGCNGFKPAYKIDVDPDTGEEAPLFHPHNQRWEEHFG